jgi:hypothetical protein
VKPLWKSCGFATLQKSTLENLIAEIEDMGLSERPSGESNLVVILLDLLKWQFQPDQRSGSISLISNLKPKI